MMKESFLSLLFSIISRINIMRKVFVEIYLNVIENTGIILRMKSDRT